MDITELRKALQRAAALFSASGAKEQREAMLSVDKLVADAGDASVDDFVQRTRAALSRPPLAQLPDETIVEQLYAVGGRKTEGERLLAELKAKELPKEKLAAIASGFTGLPAKSLGSKSKAVKAVEDKLRERAYLEAKDAMNERVTPW